MNSDQEKVIFEQYGWEYNFIAREWVSPDGTKLTTENLMGITADREGDISLMRLIVERGQREV